MYFNYDHLKFRYEPFPIGLAKPLVEESIYREFVRNWPPQDLFKYIPKVGKKYSLSPRFHGRKYDEFVRSNPVWRDFRDWITGDAFVEEVLEVLKAHNLDIGYGPPPPIGKRLRRGGKDLLSGRLPRPHPRLSTRFEFSMLPADGGSVIPHTDAPQKVVTMVVSIVEEGEWKPEFGGGTDVNRPKSLSKAYNQMNAKAEFDEVEVLDTFEFTPNQAVIFIKTFNSWHSVRPMTGHGSAAFRKTLTINLEADS